MSIPVLQLNRAYNSLLLQHFLALDSEDLRFRFGHAVTPDWLRSYVNNINYGRDEVFGVLGDKLEIAGAAHLAIMGEMAEFGVSVVPDYRSQGIGKSLFERSSSFARNHYVKKFFIHCLAENQVMVHIAQRNNMIIIRDDDEANAYLKLPPGDPASFTDELFQTRLALFDFALKSQVAMARSFSNTMNDSFTHLKPK